ncbi:hypothetical protein B5G50_27130 [Brevibacillus brevis]|nr:hypothetical protein B5G50_27130 [Brevibacillus brevis]
MEGVEVSIDCIVVDFKNVYWNFFNPLRQWLCDSYNAAFYVKDKGFKYQRVGAVSAAIKQAVPLCPCNLT